MDSTPNNLEKYLVSSSRRKKETSFQTVPTREDIEKALDDYLSKGGKIKKIEPEWIEDGDFNTIDG